MAAKRAHTLGLVAVVLGLLLAVNNHVSASRFDEEGSAGDSGSLQIVDSQMSNEDPMFDMSQPDNSGEPEVDSATYVAPEDTQTLPTARAPPQTSVTLEKPSYSESSDSALQLTPAEPAPARQPARREGSGSTQRASSRSSSSSGGTRRSGQACKKYDEVPRGSKYPFFFGLGSSSYQIEGAASDGGRGESIWDTFAKTSGKVAGSATGDIADDFYNKYPEDIKMMADMGVRNFRLSIAWPRIFPDGTGEPNQEGIDFYHKVLDALQEACIEPWVTLYHWDLPQKLFDDYQGWTNDQIVPDFVNFAETVFKEYGSKVKYWTTFNEPYTFCMLGYGWGVHAPGRCSTCPDGGDVSTEPFLCSYNVVRAHAAAVEKFRRLVPNGKIGMNLNIDWAEPSNPDELLDVESTERHFDLAVRIYADPIYKGDFPPSVRRLVPVVPQFTTAEKAQLKKSKPDYFALNHYTSNFIKYDQYTPKPLQYQQLKDSANGTSIGPLADSPWLAVYPEGLRKTLNWVAAEYDSPPIYITENGVCVPGEASMQPPKVLKDTFRINYYTDYIEQTKLAKEEDNVDVRAYFAWTLMDNFEWGDGYDKRFGVVYVDFETLERTPKDSAKWLVRNFGLSS